MSLTGLPTPVSPLLFYPEIYHETSLPKRYFESCHCRILQLSPMAIRKDSIGTQGSLCSGPKLFLIPATPPHEHSALVKPASGQSLTQLFTHTFHQATHEYLLPLGL